MNPLTDFVLKGEHKRIQRLGDRLTDLETLIDGEAFRPILSNLYNSDKESGGQPNTDEILLLKMLVLQSFHGLSDPEMERQANDRISFRKFRGFPEKIPDHTTLWYRRGEDPTEPGRHRGQEREEIALRVQAPYPLR